MSQERSDRLPPGNFEGIPPVGRPNGIGDVSLGVYVRLRRSELVPTAREQARQNGRRGGLPGISRWELVLRMGADITITSVHNIERGKTKHPRTETLEMLAWGLGLDQEQTARFIETYGKPQKAR